MLKTFFKIYRLVLIILALVFLGWLAQKNIVFDDHLEISQNLCNDSRFITNLYPEERVRKTEKQGDECWQRIFVEPAYFKISVPRTFEKVLLKIIYANPEHDFIQIGLMKKREFPLDWRFSLKPLENKILDELNWFKLEEQGICLWQKEKKFDGIYDFVNSLPYDKKIATFFYGFSSEVLDEGIDVQKWDGNSSLKGIDYLIAKYVPLENIEQGERVWKEKQLEFWVGKEHLNEGGLEFMISAPDLTEERHEILVKEISLVLQRPATDWDNFWFDLKSFISRKYEHIKNRL